MGLITEQSPVSGLAAIQCVPCHGNILHLVTEEEAKALCQQVSCLRLPRVCPETPKPLRLTCGHVCASFVSRPRTSYTDQAMIAV